eukprot:CAMPEP_0178690346 /NCGR_PEP_ID=MMETSP0699-20121125/6022_1 /TAXON_ID=265572 /ORGANISM="Extubocellulus spinifer, Strain CCMP396" /LENGTH=55 /DNA_ID=CAMNT_0020335469 /DNA_START=173 /DNA_END=340 /DNA_ORIENTATION=+
MSTSTITPATTAASTAPMALPGVKTVSADPISTSTITPATTAAPVASAAAAAAAA